MGTKDYNTLDPQDCPYKVKSDYDNNYEKEYQDSYNEASEEAVKETRHVMTKDEFMARVRIDCAKRDKKKALLKKQGQDEAKSHVIERMIYSRRQRNLLRMR